MSRPVVELTMKQAERYQALLLRLATYEVDEPWTEAKRKALGLTIQQEKDLWQLYWKLGSAHHPHQPPDRETETP